MKTLKEML